jgi:AcrR family transcriptional regulator
MNSPGLRERKKQKTRWAIQEQALRLFAEQGYEATTVDQIAAAAEISPSTFFRYFPSKEDLVIQDRYDEMLMAGLRLAPAELGPLAAIRLVTRDAFSAISTKEEESIRERSMLTFAVPALRARSMDNYLGTTAMLRQALAERLGRNPDDLALRVFAGAVVGAMLGVLEPWLYNPDGPRLVELIDQALAQLEEGLRI